MRPLIGVTAPSRGGLVQNLAIRFSLFVCGAQSVTITPRRLVPDQKLQGLVLAGGTDLQPGLYRSERLKNNYQYDVERDELELEYLHLARKRGLPVLGICRGAQLINVFSGGTLFFNIAQVFAEANYPSSLLAKIFFRKKILIKKESRLYDAFGAADSKVNSLHSQSIDQLGDDLKVTAHEPSGIVQAVESEQKPYLVGVQFHPEFLIYRRDIRQLFREFVDACQRVQA